MEYKNIYNKIKSNIQTQEENIPNIIRVKADREVILEIGFNKDKQKLSIMSTGIKLYPLAQRVEYFRLILRDRFGNEVINKAIYTGENADEFKRIVDGEEFEVTDSIELIQYEIGTIKIINYPSLGREYELRKIKEKFRITNKGLSEYLYPNKIIINNDNKEEVGKVEFDIKNNLLIVTATGVQSTRKVEAYGEYMDFILLDENLSEKYEGNINVQDTAYYFENELTNGRFKTGDVIKLRCKNPTNIIITNYRCKRKYNLEKRFNFFKITENNLVPYNVELLKTSMKIKNKDNSYIIEILFINNKKVLIIDSTGIRNFDSEYVSFKLMDSFERQIKLLATLNKNETGDKMMQKLDNKKFEDKDIIELSYSDNTLIEIINYPTSSKLVYSPMNNSEKFMITSKGLEGFIIPTKIIIKNVNGEIVARIGFNMKEKVLKVDATENIADHMLENNIYFAIEILDSKTLKGSVEFIRGKESAKNFANKLNNKFIKEEEVIRLNYTNSNRVEITNYPKLKNKTYNPKANQENFRVDLNGLKSYPLTLNNNIIFISNNEVIGTIMFDIEKNKLIVNTTDKVAKCPSGFGPYLTFQIFRKNEKILTDSIRCNETGKMFAVRINDFVFNYNDEILMKLILPNKFIITNLFGLGNDLELSGGNFIITPAGLKYK